MYGKNLTFKTGGVDGCDCEEILQLIKEGKIDTTPLITHRYPLARIGCSHVAGGLLLSRARFLVRLHSKITKFLSLDKNMR